MKFGIFFELQRPRPWVERGDEVGFREALAQARIADRIGVQHLWAQEHHFLEEYSHSSAPEVFLAACSQITDRIRLGFGIALMSPRYNHPARNAERIAALDAISGGRVEWGTGESSSRIELEGFGVPYAEKRAMWHEGVQETAKLLSMSPYPGFEGKYFSMPCRNLVPKPSQRPHPPAWVACSNRETLRFAASKGLGALTFAFMDHREAKFWVEEYYDVFERTCHPIARSVNPNVAMLTGFMLNPSHETAIARAEKGLKFFAYGLAHYFRQGVHVPGKTDLWQLFEQVSDFPMAGTGGIGSPDHVGEVFESFEHAGVDQVILLQQAAGYVHEHICDSLELFGESLLPRFVARDEERARAKAVRLDSAIRAANANIPTLDEVSPPQVAAYPLLLERNAIATGSDIRRSLGNSELWRAHMAGQSNDEE